MSSFSIFRGNTDKQQFEYYIPNKNNKVSTSILRKAVASDRSVKV